MSQICNLGLSFYFMSKNGKHFLKFLKKTIPGLPLHFGNVARG